MANAQFTKKELAESLKRLATSQSFDKITVGQIVQECGVNRQTFYYHFADKYELLDYIYYTETFVPLTQNLSFENWFDRLEDLLTIMRKNKPFYINTIKCSGDFFEEYLLRMLIKLFTIAINDLDEEGIVREDKKILHAKIFAYGLTGTVCEWAMDGMSIEPHDLAYDVKSLVEGTEQIAYRMFKAKKEE